LLSPRKHGTIGPMKRNNATALGKKGAASSRAAKVARPARRNPSKPAASGERPGPQAFFDRLPQPQRGLAEALRRVVRSADPGLVESIKWGMPWYGKGAGLAGEVCYISVHNDHVNLGFPRGTSLTDRGGMLEGTGKRMRHVKIRDEGDVQPGLFSSWVREAARLVQPAAGGRRRASLTPTARRPPAPARRSR
jgi:hypothetical protein